MDTRFALRARGWSGAWPVPLRPATLVLVALLLCLPLLFSSSARAERPAPVGELDPDASRERGLDLVPVVHAVDGERLVEVRIPDTPAPDDAPPAARLLDVTADGARVATVDLLGRAAATLAVSTPEGSVVLRDLPGVLAAAFDAGGAALTVIDSSGRLWRVDTATGDADVIADGPFGPPIVHEPSGAIVLTAVSSVEAPFQSRLVRIDPASAEVTHIADDELVVAARLLADGTVAYAAHDLSGRTVVKRLTNGGAVQLADLGPDAVQVDIAADASRIAFTLVGDGVFVVEAVPGAAPHRLTDGEAPRFSPSGERLLVRAGGASRVVELDGSVSLELSQPTAAWLSCTEGC